MTNLEYRIAEWHEKAHGRLVDKGATYAKLLEEVGELAEALIRGDQLGIFEEAGDAAFVLAHIVRGFCPNAPSLEEAMSWALDKNLRRLQNGRDDKGGNHD